MDEKQVNKWLRRRFSQVGWVLIVYFFIMNVLASLTVMFSVFGGALRDAVFGDGGVSMALEAAMNNGWGYILAVAVGVIILHAWKGGEYWKREILVKEKSMTAGVFFSMVCLFFGVQLINSIWLELLELVMNQFGHSLMPMLESVSGSSDSFSMFLYMAILAPVSEEILFRGYVLRTLRPYGKRFAILGSAFLFGMFHGNLLQAPLAFLLGLLLGYVAVEYSVLWSIALHGFNNLVMGDLLARLTSLLPEVANYAVNWALMLILSAVSVVLLLVKRSEIRAYRQADRMDRRCLKCFFSNSGILVLTVLMTVMMAFLMVM